MKFPLQPIGIALFAVAWGLPAIAATTIIAEVPPASSDGARAVGFSDPVPSEIERSDLVAQQRMADAAEATLPWVIGSVIVGGLSVAGLLVSIVFTAAATRAASISARAALASVDLERESTDATLRPYIFAEQRFNLWLTDPKDEEKVTHWRMDVVWRNFGQTPARNVNCRMAWGAFEKFPEDFDFSYFDDDPSVGGVGPSQTFHNHVDIPVDILEKAHNKEVVIHLWSVVEYDGLPGGRRHSTRLHNRVSPQNAPTSKDAIFRFGLHAQHNSFDED